MTRLFCRPFVCATGTSVCVEVCNRAARFVNAKFLTTFFRVRVSPPHHQSVSQSISLSASLSHRGTALEGHRKDDSSHSIDRAAARGGGGRWHFSKLDFRSTKLLWPVFDERINLD
eukprot:Selendium_serpulae@DN2691_c0_g1_i1.p1